MSRHTIWYDQLAIGDWIRVTNDRWGAREISEGIVTSITDTLSGGKFITIGHRIYGLKPTLHRQPQPHEPHISKLVRNIDLDDHDRQALAHAVEWGYPTPTPKTNTTTYTDIPLFD
ncbi:hypothetical protein [Bifidobacterium pseudolongum]|uniref:Uncharacterized protein n=1 Tax=Bifidobacterium pseudolongum subsp. globosum TaxID=1690 RepID=A0A4Q5AT70_9BIFI|nr:hypothetical protein [Bifidobacterium pseudolongum]RYQ36306.1 hypothetical protein PG2003B_1143 [Bifidobacterium pseudolongum subsp. globosum]